MGQKFANGAAALLVGALSDTATSFTVEAAAAELFPVANTPDWVNPNDWFKAVLEKPTGEFEIVYVGQRNAGSGLFGNVLRGREGTAALTFLSGALVGLRITSEDIENSLAGNFEEVNAQRLNVDGPATGQPGTAPGHFVTVAQLDELRRLPAAAEMKSGSVYPAPGNFTIELGLTPGDLVGILNPSAAAITMSEGPGVTLQVSGLPLTGSRTIAAKSLVGVYAYTESIYYLIGSGIT